MLSTGAVPRLLRRELLQGGLRGLSLCMAPSWLAGCSSDEQRRQPLQGGPGDASREGGGPAPNDASHEGGIPAVRLRSNLAALGALADPDANGLRLPEGFSARVLARAGEAPISGGGYLWHHAPDGGATFPLDDGGWVYTSNSETLSGGVGALRFDANGDLVDAYSILTGTAINCAGGPTPWGTWLSCEEHDAGHVFECDPSGATPGVVRPALGVFAHEAVAVDPVNQHLYLTEDKGDGRLYRYVPDAPTSAGFADLTAGRLEVAAVSESGSVEWLPVPDPSATVLDDAGAPIPTRMQVPESTSFRGGEGIWYHAGVIYFSTKGDNRVWAYDVETSTISVLYDANTAANPILRGVDNLTGTCCGDILVAEDGDDMQIVAILADGTLKPLVQIVGQDESEITGPAFDPSGTRLYFSSQRPEGVFLTGGITYEVTGPFHLAE
jgi:secreted PhoX family phosphatase